jgi:hypothetical protein
MNVVSIKNKSVLFLLNISSDFLKERVRIQSSFFYNSFIFDYNSESSNVDVAEMHERLETFIVLNNIDIIFFHYYLACPIYPHFLLSLKNKYDLRIVLFNNDDEILFSSVGFTYAQVSDSIITTDPVSNLRYIQTGFNSFFSPDHQDPRIFDSKEVVKKIYDISFIGNIENFGRKDYINYLIENGYNVSVFGSNSKNGYLTDKEYVEIIKKTKINLNFTRISSHAVLLDEFTEFIFGTKGRPFEISLLGGLTLSERSIALETCFNDDEILFFNSEEDLINKVEYLLGNPLEQESIAEKAYKKAVLNYTPEILFNKIFSWLDECLYSKNNNKITKIRLTDSFIISYLVGHIFRLKKSLLKFKLTIFIKDFKFLWNVIFEIGILRFLYLLIPLIRYSLFKK